MSITETAVDRELLLVPVPAPSHVGTGPDQPAEPAEPSGLDEGPGPDHPTRHGERPGRGRSRRRDTSKHRRPRPKRAPSPRIQLVRVVLGVVAVVLVGLVAELTVVSSLEHRSAQVTLFNRYRSELALGTAPLGPVGSDRRPLPLGTPIAILSIPSIGVRQVVQEGTSAAVLADGPGHLRSTVFPGGDGTSIVLGRANAYGGPFGRIADLHKGATMTVVTQAGTATFHVVNVHKAGARVLGPVPGTARITLGTASGAPFAPSGVEWVDADKTGRPLPSFRPLVHSVPADEQPLGTDPASLWLLLLGLEVLACALALAGFSWRRRGHAQTWIVFTAPILLVGIFVADQLAHFLPNLT